MKNIILLFILLIPAFLFAQYPATGNKQRLGYQTTGDGLIWRGVAADTAIKPRTINNAYFQLDTVNGILRRYIATRGKWQTVSGGSSALTMPFDSITFNPTTVDPDTAELKYSQDLETFVFGADGTIIEIGQKTAWYVKNQSGSTINKGTVVRAAGTLGSSGRILIEPMEIDGTVNSKYLLGITASNIADGADGYVIHFGKLRKFNTSAWTDGAVLYADAAGGLTATEPNPPDLRLPIAFVVHSHATNGVLAIRIQTGNMLDELHDVDTTGITSGGTLVWDEALSKWKAAPPDYDRDSTNEIQTLFFDGGTGDLSISDGNNVSLLGLLNGYTSGTGTAGRLPYWNTSTSFANSPIAYNSTTKRTTWDSPGIIELPMGTDAQRPTATTSDFWYNTTGNGIEWYNGSRWAKGLESTFNRGTATRIPYFDANGQVTETSALWWNAAVPRLEIAGYINAGTFRTFPSGEIYFNNGGTNSAQLKMFSPAGGLNLTYYYINNAYVGQFTADASQFAINHNLSINIGQQTATGPYVLIGGTGVSIGRAPVVSSSYHLHIQGTNAIGLPRGTVAERPTIASSTTPIRYNTDSTALEYGESVGTWRQISSRAYARSLVSGLTPDTWLGSRLALGSVTVQSSNSLAFKQLSSFSIKNSAAATATKIVNSTISFHKTTAGDTGGFVYLTDTIGADESFYFGQLDFSFVQNSGSGRQLSKAIAGTKVVGGEKAYFGVRNDTSGAVSVVRMMYGDRYSSGTTPDVHRFKGATPNAGTTSEAAFSFEGNGASGKLNFKIDDAFNVRENGRVYMGIDSTFLFDPSTDVLQLSQYGTGTKEASDLSKTESVYSAWYATDGTVLEKRANTEQYFTITSTSSPQTLSNTISDNLINQGGTQATFTLTFPASPVDGQVLKITYNNAITTLTLDGNGNTIVGSAVTTGVAGSQRAFKFYTGIGWIKLY